MQDIKEQRIYCSEQIFVPDELPLIMKNFTKAAIKEQPKDLLEFAHQYFEEKFKMQQENEEEELKIAQKPDENSIKAIPEKQSFVEGEGSS